MATVGATEFKAKCLELMDRVQANGETFVITKRGKPVAKLVPLGRTRGGRLFGCLAARASIKGDLMAPAVPAESWETVNEALREYLQRRKRRDLKKLFGTIDFRPDWDYKKARRR